MDSLGFFNCFKPIILSVEYKPCPWANFCNDQWTGSCWCRPRGHLIMSEISNYPTHNYSLSDYLRRKLSHAESNISNHQASGWERKRRRERERKKDWNIFLGYQESKLHLISSEASSPPFEVKDTNSAFLGWNFGKQDGGGDICHLQRRPKKISEKKKVVCRKRNFDNGAKSKSCR